MTTIKKYQHKKTASPWFSDFEKETLDIVGFQLQFLGFQLEFVGLWLLAGFYGF